ncbi:hypothetical protein [Amycolatopsis sp. MJM2582]|uniref:hypothetical protein n=1 Tax=Amycolatopsis sp. MJM2582 TaxID=1427749 RepID=UPI001376E236|nr:hypothetical protein [Amycolatopsis sp. MJM2582]
MIVDATSSGSSGNDPPSSVIDTTRPLSTSSVRISRQRHATMRADQDGLCAEARIPQDYYVAFLQILIVACPSTSLFAAVLRT